MSSTPSTSLFEPLKIGRYEIANRVTMAALTRQRAGESGVPTQLHAQYYAQRAGEGAAEDAAGASAGAGLVVTEGTYPALRTRTFPGQAGIETEEHAAGWREVVDRVHAAGGVIFMQVMHGGRVSHPDLLGGELPEAPSAITHEGEVHTFDGKKTLPVPRELETEDIPRVIEQFRAAARRAVDAGLDGVEIHNANGYLLHQFMAPSSNQRDDEFGGSAENRRRFSEMVIRAVVDEIGADRVGIRFSPEHNIQGVIEEDRDDVYEVYGGLLDAIADLGLAYVSFLHLELESELIADLAKRARANGVTKVIGNFGFRKMMMLEQAEEAIALPYIDAVAVGRQIIANPDLVRRWREGLELNQPDMDTFYFGGEKGYTDYPFAP